MHSSRRLAPVIALAATVCASPGSPALAATPIAPPQLPAVYDAPPGSALAPAALDRWWLLFQDPVLNALEEQAFAAAPDALTQESRIVEARATEGTEIASTFPTGEINGKASVEHEHAIGGAQAALFPVGGTFETESVDFQPSWEIDFFGRLATQRKIAKSDYLASRFNIEGARATLAASVADDYFQAAGLAGQIEDERETVRIEGDLEHIAREKANIGLGPASDADRVSGEVAQARAVLEDLESQFHAVRRALLVLIGQASAPVDTIKVPADLADAPPAPASLPTELLTRRPDVREAEERLKSEKGADRLRHLAIFPTFTFLPQAGALRTVEPSVGYRASTQTLFPIQQTTAIGFWTWGGSVTMPLLDIPRLLYEAKAEDARTRQAAIDYEKTVQSAFGDAENALVNLAAGRRASTILTDGEAHAHLSYQAAQTRYAMGVDDLTTALSAEESWRTIHSALTSERAQSLRRAVVVYKALGGGWNYETLARRP
jgi:NodT family efflux transporter outer membrane factor (OMF) lipoprotein